MLTAAELQKLDNFTLCLYGNILSPLELFVPQLSSGPKLVPKYLVRQVHTKFLCFLAGHPQKIKKTLFSGFLEKAPIYISGRNIMGKHSLLAGQHRAAV